MLKTISSQEAKDKGFFGVAYHGTPKENVEKIKKEGFKIYKNIYDPSKSHGYPNEPYYDGIPAPIDHLGFGVYFTTSQSIGKKFNQGKGGKSLMEFYLDIPNILTINFGSEKTMMKWWINNGYDLELAKQGEEGRIKATQKLTDNLKSKYDAVHFLGKSIRPLLDREQIVVFDPSRIYLKDDSNATGLVIGAKIITINDIYDFNGNIKIPKGTKGIIIDKKEKPINNYSDEKIKEIFSDIKSDNINLEAFYDFYQNYYKAPFFYHVKFAKGGTYTNIVGDTIANIENKIKKEFKTLLLNLIIQ